MTHWLQHQNLPGDFVLEADCELREPGEDGGVVRCRGIELTGEEITTHLESGKQVVRLAVCWDEQLSLLLCEDLVLRRLKFADKLVTEHDELGSEDPLARLDADFALMSELLSGLQTKILEVFGGEARD